MRQKSCQRNNIELMTNQRHKLRSTDFCVLVFMNGTRQNRIIARLDPRPLLLDSRSACIRQRLHKKNLALFETVATRSDQKSSSLSQVTLM